MPSLILARHSSPRVDPEIPAAEWTLSDEGRVRAEVMAGAMRPHRPQRIYSSNEPKAIETATIVADCLSIPFQVAPGVHEHEGRDTGRHLPRPAFDAKIAEFFENPSRLVFGTETADDAHRRLAASIRDIAPENRFGSTVVVSHGTVISLFIGRSKGMDCHRL